MTTLQYILAVNWLTAGVASITVLMLGFLLTDFAHPKWDSGVIMMVLGTAGTAISAFAIWVLPTLAYSLAYWWSL